MEYGNHMEMSHKISEASITWKVFSQTDEAAQVTYTLNSHHTFDSNSGTKIQKWEKASKQTLQLMSHPLQK